MYSCGDICKHAAPTSVTILAGVFLFSRQAASNVKRVHGHTDTCYMPTYREYINGSNRTAKPPYVLLGGGEATSSTDIYLNSDG